jgi:hypothetical protein
MVLDQQAILDNAADRAALASLIKKEMGVPKDLAHRHAAAAHQFLKRSKGLGLDSEVEDVLRGASGPPLQVQTPEGPRIYDSEADYLKQMREGYAKAGVKNPEVVAKSQLTRHKNSGRAVLLSDASLSHAIFPSQRRANKIMEEAYKAFEAGGERLPDSLSILGEEMLKRVKRAGPAALLLGLPAGFAAVKFQKAQKERLQGLRREQRARMSAFESSMKRPAPRKRTRAMKKTAADLIDAAPGLAAVPGFITGYSSPELFNPRVFFPSMAPETISSTRGRLLSGTLAAATAAGVAGIPQAFRNTYRALVPKSQKKAEDAPMIIQKRAAARISDSLRAVYGDF